MLHRNQVPGAKPFSRLGASLVYFAVCFFILVGAWLSLQVSQHTISPTASHAGMIQSFLGGIVLIFGARLAGGCPSGHGLTGMAKLSLGSFVTVIFMFVGGGLTALFI